VHAKIGGLTSTGHSHTLDLLLSVVLVVTLIRKNMTQDVAGAFFDVSQPTVSHRCDLLRPVIGEVLDEFIPDPRKLSGKGSVLVDGTICPTWDWSAVPDLFSGKTGYHRSLTSKPGARSAMKAATTAHSSRTRACSKQSSDCSSSVGLLNKAPVAGVWIIDRTH
jgi:hypothetical protein